MASIAQVIREEIARMVSRELRGAGITGELKAITTRLDRIERRIAALEADHAQAPRPAPARSTGKIDRRKLRFSGESLKRLRGKLGVSQAELATLLGVSGNAVWQWEAGRARPRAESIQSIREIRGLGKRELRGRLDRAP